MYTDNRVYLNNYDDRYKRTAFMLGKDYTVIDLCAGNGGISEYYENYYGCDIAPAGEKVVKCTDDEFIKQEFGDGEKILTVFGYGGLAGLENLQDEKLKESEKLVESSTLDDSIQKMLPKVRFFVLEGTKIYVDGYIKKYGIQGTIIDKQTNDDNRWVLDRVMYIIDVQNI